MITPWYFMIGVLALSRTSTTSVLPYQVSSDCWDISCVLPPKVEPVKIVPVYVHHIKNHVSCPFHNKLNNQYLPPSNHKLEQDYNANLFQSSQKSLTSINNNKHYQEIPLSTYNHQINQISSLQNNQILQNNNINNYQNQVNQILANYHNLQNNQILQNNYLNSYQNQVNQINTNHQALQNQGLINNNQVQINKIVANYQTLQNNANVEHFTNTLSHHGDKLKQTLKYNVAHNDHHGNGQSSTFVEQHHKYGDAHADDGNSDEKFDINGKKKDHDAYYKYSYDVKDYHTGDVKNHQEERNGDEVRGEYSLLEKDGNVRTVKYFADWKTGFHAQVLNSKG